MSTTGYPRFRRLRATLAALRRRHRCRPGVESLEERRLLATVNWISTGSGNWDVAANWSTGQVPGPGDDVVINVAGATPTVTIDSSTQAVVNSVQASDPLAISGGSLSVAANSTISAGLAMTSGGSLTATGPNVTMTVTGTTSLSAANLTAATGAFLNLPSLTSYDNPLSDESTQLEATGTGSVLNLPALASLVSLKSLFAVDASDGGQILMPSLTSINTLASQQATSSWTPTALRHRNRSIGTHQLGYRLRRSVGDERGHGPE